MLSSRTFLATCAALALASCNDAPPTSPAIGEAWAGPASVALHADIDLKSPVVATAHHGDRLEILGQRRRWYKVRTPNGGEGWTSDRDLLDADQMTRLRALSDETAHMPSQGKATVFSAINVHSEPSRQATSFLQVQPKETFDVVAHRVVQRGPAPRRQILQRRAKAAIPKKAKAKEKTTTVALPPPPTPPAPPPDWLDLSKSDAPDTEPDPDPAAPPLPKDDFTLIRTAEGQSGWVLTSAIYLKIPDDVAQYAEGHRITSYFPIGKVRDGDETKEIWLWTTSERLGAPYDFDGFRVFSWNLRRHRYETAFIQRRESGYFPVEAGMDPDGSGHFSVCLDDVKTGTRMRRAYTMIGNTVKFAGEKPCEPETPDASAPEFSVALKDPATARIPGWRDKLRTRWNKLLGRKP